MLFIRARNTGGILRRAWRVRHVRNSRKFDVLRQWDFHPIAAAGSIIEGRASRQGQRGWIFAMTVQPLADIVSQRSFAADLSRGLVLSFIGKKKKRRGLTSASWPSFASIASPSSVSWKRGNQRRGWVDTFRVASARFSTTIETERTSVFDNRFDRSVFDCRAERRYVI